MSDPGSPLPWTYRRFGGFWYIYAANEIRVGGCFGTTPTLGRANAACIVRAVNAEAALRKCAEALQLLAEAACELRQPAEDEEVAYPAWAAVDRLADRARAALAALEKAEKADAE